MTLKEQREIIYLMNASWTFISSVDSSSHSEGVILHMNIVYKHRIV